MEYVKLVSAIFLIGLAGCTHNRPYRTMATSDCVLVKAGECETSVRHALAGAEVQPFITYVEFDEQGEMHERELAKAALDELGRRASARQTIMLLFAHGWKHNAEGRDQNVEDFQTQLVKLATRINEDAKKPINVEGVYLGWRGLSLKTPLLKETTFWARKRAAARIGLDGAAEIIAELASIRARGPTDGGRHTLILSGHSFGGALLYSATAHMLLRELVQAQECEKRPAASSKQIITLRPFSGVTSAAPTKDVQSPITAIDKCRQLSASVADLVMLVNPAIEQARFSPIEKRAADIAFRPGQKPVFAVFMSRDDFPTRRLFPLGRFFSTVFNLYSDSEQRHRDVNALGHVETHWTHDLDFPAGMAVSANNPHKPTYESANGPALSWDQYVCGKSNQWLAGNGTLKRISGSHSSHSPYMIVSVDGDGIGSHTDIWGEQFTDFIERFIASGVLRPEVDCNFVPSPSPSPPPPSP